MLGFCPPLPLLHFGLEFSSFGVFCVWRRQALRFMFCWTRCDDSNPSSLVPNPLESRVLTNWSFSRSWENPNPLWYSLEFSRSFNFFWKDLLGICSRDSCEGILQVSLDLDFVCSRFNIWSLVHGLSGSNRSDRCRPPVWPVWLVWPVCCTGLTGPWLWGLQIFSFASVFSLAGS